ncbi:hypothetical protein HK405_015815, partial [Cladochytrium tenue]
SSASRPPPALSKRTQTARACTSRSTTGSTHRPSLARPPPLRMPPGPPPPRSRHHRRTRTPTGSRSGPTYPGSSTARQAAAATAPSTLPLPARHHSPPTLPPQSPAAGSADAPPLAGSWGPPRALRSRRRSSVLHAG